MQTKFDMDLSASFQKGRGCNVEDYFLWVFQRWDLLDRLLWFVEGDLLCPRCWIEWSLGYIDRLLDVVRRYRGRWKLTRLQAGRQELGFVEIVGFGRRRSVYVLKELRCGRFAVWELMKGQGQGKLRSKLGLYNSLSGRPHTLGVPWIRYEEVKIYSSRDWGRWVEG